MKRSARSAPSRTFSVIALETDRMVSKSLAKTCLRKGSCHFASNFGGSCPRSVRRTDRKKKTDLTLDGIVTRKVEKIVRREQRPWGENVLELLQDAGDAEVTEVVQLWEFTEHRLGRIKLNVKIARECRVSAFSKLVANLQRKARAHREDVLARQRSSIDRHEGDRLRATEFLGPLGMMVGRNREQGGPPMDKLSGAKWYRLV